ncbi:ATP-binding cassette domain-containing protein [Georgenia subflava]|uniref:ATP-binding cassette domain-containing protein n=2 Tax=Georgenia subflava TaxID=1622177 RepID=A0A6N7ED77_9MICO|nr:ATP-binding cassette domain-containing protein [Georgenia subflava]
MSSSAGTDSCGGGGASWECAGPRTSALATRASVNEEDVTIVDLRIGSSGTLQVRVMRVRLGARRRAHSDRVARVRTAMTVQLSSPGSSLTPRLPGRPRPRDGTVPKGRPGVDRRPRRPGDVQTPPRPAVGAPGSRRVSHRGPAVAIATRVAGPVSGRRRRTCHWSWVQLVPTGTSAVTARFLALVSTGRRTIMTVLEMRGVRKSYPGVEALDGLDLAVERGEIVAVLGPNGAGKSTAFELLLGLVRPTAGTVEVLGHAPGRVRGRVGAMLQSAGLPEQVTVRELVRLVGRSYPQALEVDDVLARTSLTKRAARTVTNLSGGERQRLLLALALVGAPEVLLLDEPTAAMDVASRRSFWDQARASVEDGATVLFATHDLAEAAAVADRVLVVSAGRLVADTTADELTHQGDDDLEEVFLALTAERSSAFDEGDD